MARVYVICPICKTKGNVEISEEDMKDIYRGLLVINVANGIVCAHSFIIYIDHNLHVRDYFVADFHIDIPEIPIVSSEENTELTITESDSFKIDLIKLNMPATLLTYILRSLFLKQKIVLLSNQEFLFKHISNFFNYITNNNFHIDLTIMKENNYKDNKKQYKDSMVFKNTEMIRNYKNLINPKKLSVEKQIVNRFLTEQELGYSYIALKNEINKAYMLSKAIVDFAKEYSQFKNTEKFAENNLLTNILDSVVNKYKFILDLMTDHLREKYDIKVQKHYMNFLIDIVQNYFKMDLAKIVPIT